MKTTTLTGLGTLALLLTAPAFSQITFYEGEQFHCRAFTTRDAVTDFSRRGFNDRASSVIVGSGQWQVCDDAGYRGRCVQLRPGNYDSLSRMGFDNRLSSVRKASNRQDSDDRNELARPEPSVQPGYDYRRRADERVFDAPVTSVHAVISHAEQRCWVEREQVQEDRGGRNVGGGIVGALIGGIIGHQIGSGSGKDIATVGGAVAGAAIGSNQGRDSGGESIRNVRRCETTSNGRPEYWDVSYRFRNIEHRIQMTSAPGRTISVNRDGEPRQ